jgi:hypothetical protein
VFPERGVPSNQGSEVLLMWQKRDVLGPVVDKNARLAKQSDEICLLSNEKAVCRNDKHVPLMQSVTLKECQTVLYGMERQETSIAQ